MNRAIFTIAYPLVAALGIALCFAAIVTAGFQGEGCRFPNQPPVRWDAGWDWLLMQGMFGCGLALVVTGLTALLTRASGDAAEPARLKRTLTTLAISLFVLWTIGGLIYALTCGHGSGLWAWLNAVRPVLSIVTAAAGAGLLVVVSLGYASGLVAMRRRDSRGS